MKEHKITFRVESYLHQKIMENAQKRIGVPISVIIRDLLILGLEEQKKQEITQNRVINLKINK